MRAVFWDLDDTLLDTLPARMEALAHAYQKCIGERTDPLALWRSHRGGSLEEMGKRLLGGDHARFTAAYREHYYSSPCPIVPYAGIEEVLAGIVKAGKPMAVVTSKISWGATDELASSGLLRYFAAVVGADDTEHQKPDPEPIYAAMDRLLVTEARDVAFIGDSPADIFVARNAGCLAVAATWGTLDETALLEAGPHAIAREPAEIVRCLAAAGAR